jgi:alkylation response protein AidB-like acyl-CoA dehydrogenase
VSRAGGEPAVLAPYLTPVHDELRARVRTVLEREILPHANEWEARRHIPPEGWRALANAGLLGLPLSGDGFLGSAVFLEELGRTGYAGIRAAVGVHAYMAPSYLELFGTPDLRDAYLPAVRRGERIAALAISEEDAGTDLRHLRTVARPDGDRGYLVTGSKRHVANGSQAGFFVTLVRTRPDAPGGLLAGTSLLIVDAGQPGVTRVPEQMLGWHAADVCQVDFADVPVPADRVIGRVDRALAYLMRALDFERLVAGLLAVGGVMHCVELLDRFVRGHRIKDAPLSANQAVRHRLADLHGDLHLVRQYGYHAAWLHSQARLDTRTASVLKLKATELAVSAAHACVRYHGARGYLEDSVPARLLRDAVAGTIAAGASELMRELIFEDA